MVVYVDPVRYVRRTNQWPWPTSCHMIADSEDELHAMAKRIGMKRRWYQDGHYDLTATRRKQAIALKAREIPLREMPEKRRLMRPSKKKG